MEMQNLNIVNHPVGLFRYRGGQRGGGFGGRFKHMDWLLLAVGLIVFIMATAISATVNTYLTDYGLEAYTGYTLLGFQVGGGIAAIAALAGKRVFM
jgi:hypothetical protein